MTASQKILAEIHEALAQELLTRIRAGDVPAALIKEAREFLKDNGINGLPDKDSPFGALVGELMQNLPNREFSN